MFDTLAHQKESGYESVPEIEAQLDRIIDEFNPSQSGMRLYRPFGTVMKLWPADIEQGGQKNPCHGGKEIKGRTLQEYDAELPGISERLLNEVGKVIFIGNGFSDVPLTRIANENNQNLGSTIVCDLHDYRLVGEDLRFLETLFERQQIINPFIRQLRNVEALLDAAANGKLSLVSHYVGSSPVPPLLSDADLAINVWGPPYTTVEEQVKMLRAGGELWINAPIRESDCPNIPVRCIMIPETGSQIKGYRVIRIWTEETAC